MQLKPGSRLRSQVCATEVIVVRGGELAEDLTCGGLPMVAVDAAGERAGVPVAGLDTGTQIGKRYTDGGDLELLATKAGDGSLGVGEKPLDIKGARPLPSSD